MRSRNVALAEILEQQGLDPNDAHVTLGQLLSRGGQDTAEVLYRF